MSKFAEGDVIRLKTISELPKGYIDGEEELSDWLKIWGTRELTIDLYRENETLSITVNYRGEGGDLLLKSEEVVLIRKYIEPLNLEDVFHV